MKAIYSSSDKEILVVHDEEADVYILLERVDSGPISRNEYKEKSQRKLVTEKKVRTCSVCGKPGHRSDNCPVNLAKELKEDTIERVRCSSCHEEDHKAKDCPELETTIATLREDGLDSLRIAGKLGISLKVVNSKWAGVEETPEDDE